MVSNRGLRVLLWTVAGVMVMVLVAGCGFPTSVPIDNDAGDEPTDVTAPTEVSSLSSLSGSGEVVLSWTDPPDADLDHIEISWQPATAAAVEIDPGTGTYAATGLTNGTAYTFRFVTVDTSGNRSVGVELLATPQLATEARLSSISVDGVALTGFDPDTSSYSVIRPNGTMTVDISATTLDSAATVSGDLGSHSLVTGSNVFSLDVTAEDGVTTSTYTVNVSVEASTHTQLSDLRVNSNTVAGFSSSTFSYSITEPAGTTSVMVGADPSDPNSTVGGTGTRSVATGRTELGVVVTAEDGVTTATYTIEVLVAPTAPTGVAASDGTNGDRVVISWNSVSGAEGYRVYRRPSGGSSANFIGSSVGTTYEDTSTEAVSGSIHEYRVAALADSIQGAWSGFDSGYAGAEVGISVTFENPEEPTISLSGSSAVAKGASLAVSAAGGFSSYSWYLDGVSGHSAITGSGSSVTIATGGLSVGVHTVSLIVSNAEGSYSAQFTFTVES